MSLFVYKHSWKLSVRKCSCQTLTYGLSANIAMVFERPERRVHELSNKPKNITFTLTVATEASSLTLRHFDLG